MLVVTESQGYKPDYSQRIPLYVFNERLSEIEGLSNATANHTSTFDEAGIIEFLEEDVIVRSKDSPLRSDIGSRASFFKFFSSPRSATTIYNEASFYKDSQIKYRQKAIPAFDSLINEAISLGLLSCRETSEGPVYTLSSQGLQLLS